MIFDWIQFWADITPQQVCIRIAHQDKNYTYSTIHERSKSLGQYFISHGIKKGDRIAVMAYNCIEYIYLFSAAQKMGIVIVPLNYRLTKSEVSQLLKQLYVKKIYCQKAFENLIPDCYTTYDLSELDRSDTSEQAHYNPPSLDDDLFILFTSGSSGHPKGVRYTHRMLFWNSINTQISLKIDQDSKTLLCMPPFHTGGWNVLLTPMIHAGGTIILMPYFDVEKIANLLSEEGCTVFMGVPTMLKMMSEQANFERSNFDSLEYILVGGEAMSVDLIKKYQDKNVAIRQGYGMTEAGPNLTSLHHKQSTTQMGSIGKANMYVEWRIAQGMDSYDNSIQTGELQLKGPIVMPGYVNNDDNQDAFTEDGWLKTGDIVEINTEGYLFVVDRIKNMFISGGENVYPAEIERHLLTHPAIDQAIIIGVSDATWGEVGLALVKLKGRHSLSYESLYNFCLARMSKYKIPKHMELIDHFPITDSGKINRKKILARYKNRI